ncbi:MAG: hypothetical protein QOF44_5326, partial [Streptomyces sp.]|nr:hypothetical protein [Streptomyces sp.]
GDALLGLGLAVAVLGAGRAAGCAGGVAGAVAVEVLQVASAESGDLPAGGARHGADRLREVTRVAPEVLTDDAGTGEVEPRRGLVDGDPVLTPNLMLQALPTASALRKVLKTLGAEVHERQPGQPRHPKGPTGDAAQYLGMLRGLVEQMTTALHGGELHVDVQKGYFAVYQRSVPAMLAALAERSMYDAAFTRQGVEQVPLASIQLLTAATALQAAGDALAGASVVASGGPGGGGRLTEKDAAVVQKRTEQAWQTADLLHEYVEGKRKSWAAEDAPQ